MDEAQICFKDRKRESKPRHGCEITGCLRDKSADLPSNLTRHPGRPTKIRVGFLSYPDKKSSEELRNIITAPYC